jgi:hypothetical protein
MKWKEVTCKSERKKGLVVFVSDDGYIKVRYPKAPKWAQRAAMTIYNDIQECGEVLPKGVKDCVRGTWAYMIAKASNRYV